MDFKVDESDFEGRLDPEEFLDQVDWINKLLKQKEMFEDKKVNLSP